MVHCHGLLAARQGPQLQAVELGGGDPRFTARVSGVIAVFVVVLVAGILLMVGALVEAFVYNQLPTSGLASGQIASITTINSDVVSALALLGVGLIALGAGGVISALLGAFNFGGN